MRSLLHVPNNSLALSPALLTHAVDVFRAFSAPRRCAMTSCFDNPFIALIVAPVLAS